MYSDFIMQTHNSNEAIYCGFAKYNELNFLHFEHFEISISKSIYSDIKKNSLKFNDGEILYNKKLITQNILRLPFWMVNMGGSPSELSEELVT